ncbi:type III secretion protein J [Pseudomonas flavescens]|uniref:Lipoprotein n=1 Tax=Phytopseudomonas flavescens TaxID=29435 RepID=A0A1G8DLT2_9GAMM|nr:type III secretion inner membrane ring lipoprotein SctJ [Pseudomonas flavescens]SDH58555.1 type III secretion protein J [Pseudomonas flavescens]
MKKRLALWFCVLMLAACSEQTDLFSGLSEQDANDVIASLGDYRIDTGKRTEKSGIVVSVDRADTNRAIRILESAGLPRRARTSIGEIFKKEGVISTPLEERARYIYALSQELESTLSQIDGVIVARVHVVLPERIAPGEPVQPASAAVFIKHSERLEPDAVRQRIQMMVASSIPGMADTASADSAKFSIVFVPAAAFDDAEPLVKFGPFLLEEHQLGFWQRVLWIAPGLLILLSLVLVLVTRADWRQALFSRIAPRRPPTTLPSRT